MPKSVPWSVLLCCAALLLLASSATLKVASATPVDPKFYLDCSNKPPTVSNTQPTKSAECALGSVTSAPSPWEGATLTIGDDKSSAVFQMHGPGVGTEVAGTYRVLDVTTATALAQGTFGPVVLQSGDCTNPDVVTGSGSASKDQKVSKDDQIEVDITFTSIFKETVCSSSNTGSTSVSVSAACDGSTGGCVSVPEFGTPALLPTAVGLVVVALLLTGLRVRHRLVRGPARTPR